MSSSGRAVRRCSRQTCTRDAVTTLTYVYSDSTAVVGPLAAHAEPHAYDLCEVHADRLTVPRGWHVLRLELPEAPEPLGGTAAVARAVRAPAPAPPVREGPRAVLRDVSLPRPTGSRGDIPARTRADPSAGPEPADVPAREVPWRDVALPESLRRPHLRRPAGAPVPPQG